MTPSRHVLSAFLTCVAMGLAGCQSADRAVAPSGDPHTFLTDLVVHERAITLALQPQYDTLRLHVDALLADGTPVSGVRYEPSDSTITVDSTGLITARFITADTALVRIAVTTGGYTRRDSVQVQVRDRVPAARVARVSIRTSDGTAPRIPIVDTTPYTSFQVIVQALDQDGQPVPDVLLDVRSSDTTTVKIDNSGNIYPVRIGKATLTATGIVYGRRVSDSLPYSVGPSLYGEFNLQSPTDFVSPSPRWKFEGDTVVQVAPGGRVLWRNAGKPLATITFADPTHIMPASADFSPGGSGGGNIIGIGAGTIVREDDYVGWIQATYRARLFPVAGTYPFEVAVDDAAHTRLHGVVIVCDKSVQKCPY